MIDNITVRVIIATTAVIFMSGCTALGNFPNSADTVTVYTTPPPPPLSKAVSATVAPTNANQPVGVPAG
jgi:hypothetical protein